jgi:hypothetical protein
MATATASSRLGSGSSHSDASAKNYVISQVDSRGGPGADGGQQPVAPPEHLTDAVGTTGVRHMARLVL